jgi:glycosyl-4,4'-diaponeurosporenoate acyltransferase
VSLPIGAIVAVDAAAWLAVQAGAGYVVHRLPDLWLSADHGLLHERRWERGGHFYRDRLAIARWKGWLPEGGAVFRGGFDKRELRSATTDDLERYRRETRRAELGHWLAIVPLPLFVLWNPPFLWPAMAAYAIVVNGPCIVAQRYNRLRLSRVLAARANGSRRSAEALSRNALGTSGSSMPYGSPP